MRFVPGPRRFVPAPGTNSRIEAPTNARVIDAQRQLMLPGFVDAHVHFVFPGPLEEDQEAPRRDAAAEALTFGRQMLASGVTSARVHLDTLEHARLLLELASDECAPIPRLQVSGPAFIPGTGNDEKAPVWDVTSADDAIAKVRREQALGFQWVAIHDAMKFPEDARAAIVNTARKLGMARTNAERGDPGRRPRAGRRFHWPHRGRQACRLPALRRSPRWQGRPTGPVARESRGPHGRTARGQGSVTMKRLPPPSRGS